MTDSKENEEFFVKIHKPLLACNGYYAPSTGAAEPLTPAAKLVLVYMLDAQRVFRDTLGKSHFETQATIARACGLNVMTVHRILNKLIKNGVVQAHKSKSSGAEQKKWNYTGVTYPLMLWTGSPDRPETVKTKDRGETPAPIKQAPVRSPKPVSVPNQTDDEDGMPF